MYERVNAKLQNSLVGPSPSRTFLNESIVLITADRHRQFRRFHRCKPSEAVVTRVLKLSNPFLLELSVTWGSPLIVTSRMHKKGARQEKNF